jgi:hypothetical protein
MRRRPVFLLGSALLAPVALAACGPSYQALYESDARFEHCYALEERSASTMQQRSDCWRDWVLRYTYGQTRDRVEYAAARYRALTRAPAAPTDEAMMEAAPGEGRGVTIAAPAPTSAFAPPPKTFSEVEDGGATTGGLPVGYADAAAFAPSPDVASAPKPPGNECGTRCDAAWNDCKGKCAGRACDACAADYKKCMRGCFR